MQLPDHAAGVAANNLPARNPWFVQPGVARRVTAILAKGVNDIVRGMSSGILQAMADACRQVADGMKRNIAPAGRLGGLHVGLHAPMGVGVSAGAKMVPLSKAYAARKADDVGPRPVLVRTGEMYDSVAFRVVQG